MPAKENITFIKVDILKLWRFVHEFSKSGKFTELGKQVFEIAQALLANDLETNDTATKLLQESIDFQRKKKQAGRLGGIAKAKNKEAEEKNQPTNTNQNQNKPARRKKPPTKEEVYEFALDNNIDEVDARTWFEQNFIERLGCDTSGEVIRNWQGALTCFCKKQNEKRGKQ